MLASFYDVGDNGLWIFLLVTVIMGGTSAYVSGKAIAETWRPFWQVIGYCLLLGFVVRFIHFALFEEVLLSARNYLVDVAVLLCLGISGYFAARKRQMTLQYGWRQTP
jgi:hypothetical protein